MDVSMFTSFTDMGMMNDLSLIHQLQVNSLEELFVNNYDQLMINQPQQGYKRSSAHQNDNNVHITLEEKPTKQLKSNNWNNNNHHNHVLNSQDDNELHNSTTMLSFSNNSSSCSNQTNSSLVTPIKEEVAISNNVSFPSPENMFVSSSQHQYGSSFDKKNEASPTRPATKSSPNNNYNAGGGMSSQQSRDHILAERKRREKLSQKFIALSAIIPGLKKMDKASVLGDAIKYVKQLQERVTKLEVEAKKKSVESAVLVKKSYVPVEEDDDQISGGVLCDEDVPFPEIEAKFSDRDVVIKIDCEKKKGVFEKIISQTEELNLAVSSSSSLAFGSSNLAVTIIAQMNAEFSMTANDVVKHMHTTLKCLT